MLENALAAIEALRAKTARVHCITNTVAQNFTANVLLACGASPSMSAHAGEAAHFTGRADALLLNLGTFGQDRREAMLACLPLAVAAGKPVVLDPVMCHVSPPRLQFAKRLLGLGSLIVKANDREMAALAPGPVHCLVTTGPKDRVNSGPVHAIIANGHPLMGKVTATGCALGALIAALAARTPDRAAASVGGLLWFGVAGEIAAKNSPGPGSFAAAFLDALHTTGISLMRERAKYE